MLAAVAEPVLVTDHDQPVLVIRSLLDDDTADDLIGRHPAFAESIRRARQQKAEGRVRRLADVHQKYDTRGEPEQDAPPARASV